MSSDYIRAEIARLETEKSAAHLEASAATGRAAGLGRRITRLQIELAQTLDAERRAKPRAPSTFEFAFLRAAQAALPGPIYDSLAAEAASRSKESA